jgi:transcriptional regulator with XRE-family HTH domain
VLDATKNSYPTAIAVRKNTSIIRQFQSSGLTVSEFARQKGVSKSFVSKRTNDSSIGYRPRGRPHKISEAMLDATAELARHEQVAMNSITVPAALEAIADQTATNQRPFPSGVVPTHAVKLILQVIWFYLSCSCSVLSFIYLLKELRKRRLGMSVAKGKSTKQSRANAAKDTKIINSFFDKVSFSKTTAAIFK